MGTRGKMSCKWIGFWFFQLCKWVALEIFFYFYIFILLRIIYQLKHRFMVFQQRVCKKYVTKAHYFILTLYYIVIKVQIVATFYYTERVKASMSIRAIRNAPCLVWFKFEKIWREDKKICGARGKSHAHGNQNHIISFYFTQSSLIYLMQRYAKLHPCNFFPLLLKSMFDKWFLLNLQYKSNAQASLSHLLLHAKPISSPDNNYSPHLSTLKS